MTPTLGLQMILKPDVLPFVVGIVAIVCGCTVGAITAVTKLVIAHRERMAKIQQGIDPDRPEKPPKV
jgi:hypothetical protein